MSLSWRVFLVDAVLGATAALALSPATVSADLQAREVAVLLVGLALVLVLNFLLVRRTLVPLQRLTQTMRGLLREHLERSAEQGAADVLTAREQDGGPPFTGGRREPPTLRMARLTDGAACA